jgi:HEAT repeat protein
VVAALVPLLNDPDVGGAAAQSLGSWAGPADVPALVAALGANDPNVRTPLIRALGRLRAEAAVPALVRRLAVPEDRDEAARALQAIGQNAAPEVRKLLAGDDAELRRVAGELLLRITGNDRRTALTLSLAALNSGDGAGRLRALADLGRGPADDGNRGEVLAAVLPLLKDPDPVTRRRALKALESWVTPEQVPTLVEVLEDPDRGVRAAAVAALGKVPDRRSALALAPLLRNAELRRPAAAALEALKLKDPEVEAEVLKALESPDAADRQAACRVLRVIGTEASVPALKRAAADAQRYVATAARAALSAIDPSATPAARPAPAPRAKGAARKPR